MRIKPVLTWTRENTVIKAGSSWLCISATKPGSGNEPPIPLRVSGKENLLHLSRNFDHALEQIADKRRNQHLNCPIPSLGLEYVALFAQIIINDTTLENTTRYSIDEATLRDLNDWLRFCGGDESMPVSGLSWLKVKRLVRHGTRVGRSVCSLTFTADSGSKYKTEPDSERAAQLVEAFCRIAAGEASHLKVLEPGQWEIISEIDADGVLLAGYSKRRDHRSGTIYSKLEYRLELKRSSLVRLALSLDAALHG